jgi:hypothetical protein
VRENGAAAAAPFPTRLRVGCGPHQKPVEPVELVFPAALVLVAGVLVGEAVMGEQEVRLGFGAVESDRDRRRVLVAVGLPGPRCRWTAASI